MSQVNIMVDDEHLAEFGLYVAQLAKVEIPVQSWTHHHEGETVYGPHFRICFKADGTSAFRSAWDRDAEENVVQHDYLLDEDATLQIKSKYLQLFGGPSLMV